MAERPTDFGGPDHSVPRPPAVFYIAGAAGFLTLAGSVPVTVMVRGFSVVERLVYGGPLLLLGLVLWGFAIFRFAQYGDAVRRAREAQPIPVDDRTAEDQALIEQASLVVLSAPQIPGAAVEGPAAVRPTTPRRRVTHRPLVAARTD